MKSYIQPQASACDADAKDLMAVSVDKNWADPYTPIQAPRNYLEVEWEWDREVFDNNGFRL